MNAAFDLLIHGGDVVAEGRVVPLDVAVAEGRIAALLRPGTAVPAARVFDATGLTVLPGVIDTHVHVRAPSYPERGTVLSETRAAAAGGVTTVLEMPIAKPCCATAEILAARREHFAAQAVVNFGLFGAPGAASPREVAAMAEAGAVAFKIFTTAAPPGRDDEFVGLSVPDEGEQRGALARVAATGRLLMVHAESEPLIAAAHQAIRACGGRDALAHGMARPPVAEAVAIAKFLTLARHTGARVHIAHVTSRAALDVVRAFRSIGTDVTAETCLHYLLFTEDDVARVGVDAKINPPIRTHHDRDALWEGIADGTLSVVSTDHAPFTRREKDAVNGDMLAAPPGSPGLEFLVPAMLDSVAAGRLTLPQAVRLLSTNGAARFGLAPERGEIRPAAVADFTIVDPVGETEVDASGLMTAARECAGLYAGRRFQGRVAATVVGGQVVYDGREVVGRPGGGAFVAPAGSSGQREVADIG